MRALIVVESCFGNTLAIASAVAEGLGQFMTVEIRPVLDAPARIDDPVDLLLVGGPTHAFGLSRPDTRRAAARQAGYDAASDSGIREWLAAAPSGIGLAAAFDTRVDKKFVPGSAARAISRRLRRLGAVLVAEPESFRVVGTPGPLASGELDRARQWGEQLATRLAVTGTGSTPSGR
jgi:hypothetical protein